MTKINKNLSRLYACPPEKIPESVRPKVDDSLIMWYDNLRVNPMLSYFTVDDINKINEISSSIRLSSNPKEKYRLIGEIMESRKFKFVGGGTNRRTYVCTYDSRVVAKVGTDKIGFSNNLREYINQDVLKPFCCKIFEVSPCGTLAIIERVYPIKTMDEFQAVGKNIFDVLYFKIRAKNIAMEDIGMRSYKNWGIRDNFGAVLLDYPTMYVADKKKCFCTARDRFGNYCNHTLDYDEGFDNIICTSCGHRYLSKSIAKKNGDSITELIYAAGNRRNNNKKGECKMKISFTGRNGKLVEKDLNSGRTDYVKVQYAHNPYAPITKKNDSVKMDDKTYQSKFGHKKHNLGVSFSITPIVSNEPETIPEEKFQSIMSVETMYNQLNILTTLENVEISDILFDHIVELKDALKSNTNIDMPFESVKDGLEIFKMICNKINCSEIYKKIIDFCSDARKECICDKDKFEIENPALTDFVADAVFYIPKFNIYMNRVISALRVISGVGFNSEILSNKNAINNLLTIENIDDKEIEINSKSLDVLYAGGMYDSKSDLHIYVAFKPISEEKNILEEEYIPDSEECIESECIESPESNNNDNDIQHFYDVMEAVTNLENSVEFDKKNDVTPILNSIPVAPDKAAQQERFNKKNRKKNKNKNRNFNDCSNY